MMTTKFTAKQFRKYGFVHMTGEDFTDDGAKFQVWTHEGTGLKVTYTRLADAWGTGEAEVFLSVRTWELGLEYADYSKLPHYHDCDKYNGTPESMVDLDDLVSIMLYFKADILAAKERIENEELDMEPVIERAAIEHKCIAQVLKMAKGGAIEWWNLNEWQFKYYKGDIERLENSLAKLDGILTNGFGDKVAARKAWNRFNDYGYVEDKCDEDRKHASYGELFQAVMGA